MLLSICNRSPINCGAYIVVPVTFVPGRSRLLTSLNPTGSLTASITIGVLVVAAAAAMAAGALAARMIFTLWSTNSAITR